MCRPHSSTIPSTVNNKNNTNNKLSSDDSQQKLCNIVFFSVSKNQFIL